MVQHTFHIHHFTAGLNFRDNFHKILDLYFSKSLSKLISTFIKVLSVHSSVTDPGLSAITLSDLQNGSQFLLSCQNQILRKERTVPLSDIIFGDTICWLFFTAHLSSKVLWKQESISGLVPSKAQSSLTLNSIILVQKFSKKKYRKNLQSCNLQSCISDKNYRKNLQSCMEKLKLMIHSKDLTPILQTDNLLSEAIFLFWKINPCYFFLGPYKLSEWV